MNCVYLKGLKQAIQDGDPVQSIVRGTACNSYAFLNPVKSLLADSISIVIIEMERRLGLRILMVLPRN